jgi:hypothetical protein
MTPVLVLFFDVFLVVVAGRFVLVMLSFGIFQRLCKEAT